MPDDRDSDDGTSRLRAVLAQCQERLSERATITVTMADMAIRHLFSLGLRLTAMEDLTDDPELRRRIDGAIEEIDATILDLRRVIFESRDSEQPET